MESAGYAIVVIFVSIFLLLLMVILGRLHHGRFNFTWTMLFSEADWMYLSTSRFDYYKNLHDRVSDLPFAKYLANIFSVKILIIDPKLIEAVCVKQFASFSSRVRSTFLLNDHLTHSIFNLDGRQWSLTRRYFAKAFSTGAMEQMLPLLWQSAAEFNDLILAGRLAAAESIVDANQLARLYVGDVISTCVFGQPPGQCFSPRCRFIENAKNLRNSNSSRFRFFDSLSVIAPNLRHIFGGRISDPQASRYFQKLIFQTVQTRRKENIRREDFLQTFIDFMDSDSQDNCEQMEPFEWTWKTTEAHCIVFILGGFTASSSALSFSLYEIAKNAEVQNELKREIREQISTANNNVLRHKDIQNMIYLDQVISDTDVTVKSGTSIVIPTSGIHHNPKYYPNPDRFLPERFDEENRKRRPAYTYIPFGVGPRMCIGQRFALLLLKTAIISILSRYNLSLPAEHDKPVKFSPRKFTTTTSELRIQFSAD